MEINGKHTKLPEGTTILDYLEQNHYVLAQIAVEHNYVILDKEDYAKVVLKDDDILELNAGKREIKKPEKSRKTEKSKKREKQKRGKKDERNNKRYMEIRRA